MAGLPLILRFRGIRGRLRLVVMVKYFANTSTCTLGDFTCAFDGSDADVLAGDGRALAHIAGGVNRV